jgi:hypothetical protein
LTITILIGKTSINGPFSIAMLNYQRVIFEEMKFHGPAVSIVEIPGDTTSHGTPSAI